MTPDYADDLKREFRRAYMPGKTFKLTGGGAIRGNTDGLDAIRQAIYLMLSVERYKYAIYSWNYGAELSDLIGQPVPLVYSMISQRITEALMQDDRIQSVDNFSFEREKGRVAVTFTVGTAQGDIEIAKEVSV